ncbi:MAG: hypothetical protein LH628_02030 [Microcoleus sp. CAN_BIN18]|nr:hypothetical protein [Microcoleus sp. CAN_BIN18]
MGYQEEYAEGKISQIKEEGRRKKEEGNKTRREEGNQKEGNKKEEAIKSYISKIKNVLNVLVVVISSK